MKTRVKVVTEYVVVWLSICVQMCMYVVCVYTHGWISVCACVLPGSGGGGGRGCSG